jgi:hypothetical protein
VYDELLFLVDKQTATQVERVALSDLDLHERAHLQEWILSHPQVLGPDVTVITSEYDRWQTASGDPVLDRLDILALDPDGRLVVVELKRGAAPHTIHMQAINYAAMVSRLRPEDIADLYSKTQTSRGHAIDVDSALTELSTANLLSAESIRHPRIVLVASDYPASVTAAVVWLNEQGVDLSLIRFRAYRLGGQTVVSFSRLFPVPDVEEFTIGRRAEKATSVSVEPGEPWDAGGLARLAEQGNPTTLALLDLCALENPVPVGVVDIAHHAGITPGSVRGQLAGLTMRLKNPKYGFRQKTWPIEIEWLPGGVASYTMDSALGVLWRSIRGSVETATEPVSVPAPGLQNSAGAGTAEDLDSNIRD